MLCSALSVIPSTTVPSNYNVKPCSVTSAPDTSQIWEHNSIRLSSTLSEDISMLPIEASPRTSYVEEAWVVISPKLQSLENDYGSSDMCPALNEPNPLKANILPYCLTNFSQNELRSSRPSSLPSLSIRHDSSPEYLFKRSARDDPGYDLEWAREGLIVQRWDDQGFWFYYFGLFISLVLTLFSLQLVFGSEQPTNRNS